MTEQILSGIGCSVPDMVKAFREANGLELPCPIAACRPGDSAVCYAATAKRAAVLGWKAEKKLADKCRDPRNWQSNNPMRYGEQNSCSAYMDTANGMRQDSNSCRIPFFIAAAGKTSKEK